MYLENHSVQSENEFKETWQGWGDGNANFSDQKHVNVI